MVFALKIEARDLGNMARAFRDVAEDERSRIIYRALNRTGDQSFTAVKRVLAKETGLKVGRVAAALKKTRAGPGLLTYQIDARGGYLTVTKGNFGARQTRKGVSHSAWGRRTLADGAFIPNGHSVAYKRVGKGRYPIRALYGPAIPKEMIRGESDNAIRAKIATVFIPRVLHETNRSFAKVKGRYGL